MSSDPENNNPIETSNSEESRTSHEATTPSPSRESEQPATDPGSISVAVPEDLMREMVGLCKKQNDVIANLHQQIAEQKTALETLTKEVDATKVHEVRGTVKGLYDFAPSKEKFNEILKTNNDMEAYAKSLYDKIKAENKMY